MKRNLAAVFLSTIWISISEFVRNEFLLKSIWIKHYESLGLIFPSKPMNGVVWGIWSLCFAVSIFIFSRKFSLFQTTCISWFIGFVLMWLVIGNMNVLAVGILPIAVPLSMLESFIASLISHNISNPNHQN